MALKSQQTVEETVRPSPALLWTKKKVSSTGGEGQLAENPAKTKKPANRQPRPVAKPDVQLQQFVVAKYVLFSTKARRSVQEKLADLRHLRVKSGHEICTIKQFIEEALNLWFKSTNAKISGLSNEKGRSKATKEDPYETFNNVILHEHKNDLRDVCHERSKVDHPVKTIIAIVDDAFCLWLPLQNELVEKKTGLSVATNESAPNTVTADLSL